MITTTLATSTAPALGPVGPALLWLIPVVLIPAALIWAARSSRAGKLRAYEEETDRLVRIAEHDAWRDAASRRAFERHQRGCPRCRGDVLGQLRFTTPPRTRRQRAAGGA